MKYSELFRLEILRGASYKTTEMPTKPHISACFTMLNVPSQLDVLFDTLCKDCDVPCEDCHFEGKEPMCSEELDRSSSPGGNITLELLFIEKGFWRVSNTSTIIRACYNEDACEGGVTGAQDYCRKGYEGPC